MSLLVRKIEQAKWLQNDILNGADVSADAITNCMKTKCNALSTWHIDNEEELDYAVLAIVAGHDHLDSIDVVWLSQEDLPERGLSVENSRGDTPLEEWADKHTDIVDLSYQSLGRLADCIVTCFREERVKRYTRSALKQLLRDAITSGRLNPDHLAGSLAAKLG